MSTNVRTQLSEWHFKVSAMPMLDVSTPTAATSADVTRATTVMDLPALMLMSVLLAPIHAKKILKCAETFMDHTDAFVDEDFSRKMEDAKVVAYCPFGIVEY